MLCGLASTIVSATREPILAGFGAAWAAGAALAAAAERLALRPPEAMPAAVRYCWL